MDAVDINRRLYTVPFRPFRIHLRDGSSIPVNQPGMILVGESSVILPTEMTYDTDGFPVVKRWQTVALARMAGFGRVDEPPSV